MEKSEVANRIKELREAKKMTQNALANAAGVSPTYIYQLERGEKSRRSNTSIISVGGLG